MKTHKSSKHPVEYKEPMDLTRATSSQGQLNPKCTPEVSRNEASNARETTIGSSTSNYSLVQFLSYNNLDQANHGSTSRMLVQN